jgi:hypothetical protein
MPARHILLGTELGAGAKTTYGQAARSMGARIFGDFEFSSLSVAPDPWRSLPGRRPAIFRTRPNPHIIKGRPLWSRVLSVRLEPLQKGAPCLWIA